MPLASVIAASDVASLESAVIVDCRFSLADPAQGRELYEAGHIPGAFYFSLDEDLSAPIGTHGGRHPLPDPEDFVAVLGRIGIGPDTQVLAYDDSRFAFASRLWWMMRSLGFRPPALLNGGYAGWLALGASPETSVPTASPVAAATGRKYAACIDIQGLREAQGRSATVIDAREERRYAGLEEPIDPIAGHIPGAQNRPWQGVTTDDGLLLGEEALRAYFGELLQARETVVYCGSGVTACVDLFALATLGTDNAQLYAGSWSDWCSYLAAD